jgi:pilus assembly protein CpaC
MLLKRLTSAAQGTRTRSHKWAALCCCLVAFAPLASAVLPHPAMASDLDIVDVATENDSNFVRIGLGKSIVIRLPADAHDVIVGDPLVVDAVVRTKNTAYLFARTLGQTNIFFFDENGKQILNLDLDVSVDVKALQKLLERAIPGTKIIADQINNSVVLRGTAPNAAEAKTAVELAEKFMTRISEGVRAADTPYLSTVINTIKITGEDQVMLKVRIVEVQREVIKQFGVDLNSLLQFGALALNFNGFSPLVGGTSLTSSYASGTNSVTAVIRALESDGLLKTLAEPNLTAVSGQAARFRAGGQVPIQSCNATSGCTVTYRDFGVSLNFTPVVLSEGRINLRIQTDVSDRANDVGGLPSFNSRSAETVVELPSGGSMMLAGLIKDSVRQTISGTPGLKQLPVLGALFRSREFSSDQTELVVIVTPYLVGSVAEKQLATPGDHLNVATDRQTILLGRLNKIYGTPGNNPDGVYHGSVGFIVE